MCLLLRILTDCLCGVDRIVVAPADVDVEVVDEAVEEGCEMVGREVLDVAARVLPLSVQPWSLLLEWWCGQSLKGQNWDGPASCATVGWLEQ